MDKFHLAQVRGWIVPQVGYVSKLNHQKHRRFPCLVPTGFHLGGYPICDDHRHLAMGHNPIPPVNIPIPIIIGPKMGGEFTYQTAIPWALTTTALGVFLPAPLPSEAPSAASRWCCPAPRSERTPQSPEPASEPGEVRGTPRAETCPGERVGETQTGKNRLWRCCLASSAGECLF